MGLSSKMNISKASKEDESYKGNAIIYFKNQNLNFDFLYNNYNLIIKKGRLKSSLINSNISGNFKIFPFFIFNLDLDAKSLNSNKSLKALKYVNKNHKEFYKNLAKKINGILNINIEKIYSKNKLFKSAELKFELLNQDLYFKKILLELSNFGATDMTGKITGKKKQNIF